MRRLTAIVLSLGLSFQAAQAMERENRLPDGTVTEGQNDIRKAWLSQPTTRYGHGVLGDAIEAGALSVVTRKGQLLTLTLPQNAVFEDRHARLADIDGDGRDEIIVVKSTKSGGGALVIAGVREDRLKVLAQTPHIGRPNRWLNPIGMGDFDGDGENELAYVETPHIGGTLRIVKWQGDKLVQTAHASGFSNHAIGSNQLKLAGIVDFYKDGSPELVVPGPSRLVLRIVSFEGGVFQEIERAYLDAPIVEMRTDYAFFGALVAVQANGRTATLHLKSLKNSHR
ncbi:VCBS repeat-containing protein [Magnetovibrio sp. PR-2]|uniref:FG-GAP repeat domain-containing protein n=1 Tax=Magnetovibrio sp. PR-2 TaxID=3120356 RepID=UPI002FCE5A32